MLLFLLGACDSNETGEQEFPHAQPWPLATLDQVKSPSIVPDSLNVIAYVIRKYSCPEGDNCFAGSFIELSEIKKPELFPEYETLNLKINPPETNVNREYIFSIRINSLPGSPLGYMLELVGFDLNE